MSATTMSVASERNSALRRVVLADGLACGASGAVLTVAAGALDGPLGLSEAFLRAIGVLLLVVAAGVLFLATRATLPRPAVWVLAGLNLLWASGSLILLLTGWIDPTTTGVVVIIGQALLVAAIAELEIINLRSEA
jgi:hypothetical protein